MITSSRDYLSHLLGEQEVRRSGKVRIAIAIGLHIEHGWRLLHENHRDFGFKFDRHILCQDLSGLVAVHVFLVEPAVWR